MKLQTIPFDKLRTSKLPIRQAQDKQNDQGIAIIISVIILNLILVGTLVISKIFTGEIINSRILYNSTAAYYAAESGIEYMLYGFYKVSEPIIDCKPLVFNEGDKVRVSCSKEETVSTTSTTIKSTGSYKTRDGEAKRKIEINLKTE